MRPLTGFSDAEIDRLVAVLAPLARDESPFHDRDVPRSARFVLPELVVEVRFTEWTTKGRVRSPVYVGLRSDKSAGAVTREER